METDLKSVVRMDVPVQVRPGPPLPPQPADTLVIR